MFSSKCIPFYRIFMFVFGNGPQFRGCNEYFLRGSYNDEYVFIVVDFYLSSGFGDSFHSTRTLSKRPEAH